MPSEKQATPSRSESSTLREKLDTACERGVQGAVLAILIWGPLAFGAVRNNPGTGYAPHFYGFLGIQALTVLALALWAVRFFTQRPMRILWPPICWGVLAFIIYAIVRCQFVEIEYDARRELVSVILYGALFFVILNNFTRRESATAIVYVLVLMALAESIWAFYQFASHDARVWNIFKPAAYSVRGSGTFINPNNFAGYAEMILPLALAYTVMARMSAVWKVLLGYAALVIIAGVVVSESRGGIAATLAILAVFCIVLLTQRDYWKRGILALVLLAIAGGVFVMQFGNVGDRLDSAGGLHGDGREFYWDAAEKLFQQHPLWGAGPGMFKYYYPLTASAWAQVRPETAHNDYLNTLCEWGLAGFAIIIVTIGLLAASVWGIWPNVRRKTNEIGSRNSSKAACVFGAALGLLAVLIHSAVDFDMQIPANAVVAITLMALLTAQWRFATERYWVNPQRIGKFLLAATALGVAGYLACQGLHARQEFYWLVRGASEKQDWDKEVGALKTAYALEPRNYLTQYYLGECYRVRALDGQPGNEALAAQAMDWFEGAMVSNPFDFWPPLRYGMCLDWLDRPKEGTKYFVKAVELRPNNATVCFYLGRHCMELEDYPLAEHWLELSTLLHPPSEDAPAYLKIVQKRMADAAKAPPPP